MKEVIVVIRRLYWMLYYSSIHRSDMIQFRIETNRMTDKKYDAMVEDSSDVK